MEMQNRTVLGREFRTNADYQAALRDEKYITQIKKRYDLTDISGARQLLTDIKSGKYRFCTILGRDLEEETEDLVRTLECASARQQGKSRKKLTQNKFRNQSKNKSSKPVSLKDYDEKMQASIKKELKKREGWRRGIMSACILVAVGCFAYLGIYAYQVKRLDDYTSVAQNLKGAQPMAEVTPEAPVIHYNDEEIIVPDILDEYKTLYSLNKKLIGWVKIDDTYIDYPVLQTSDNVYYLTHNFDQEEDRNGSIFLDTACRILPRSTNLIIYGHHMRSGRMFGQLDKYSSQSFYEKHKYIQFDTIYETATYEVMFVFRSKIYEESEIVFKYYQFIDAASEMEFNSYMREMAEMSLYDTGVTAQFGDQLLTLSTCDYYTDYGRFVVVAKRIY